MKLIKIVIGVLIVSNLFASQPPKINSMQVALKILNNNKTQLTFTLKGIDIVSFKKGKDKEQYFDIFQILITREGKSILVKCIFAKKTNEQEWNFKVLDRNWEIFYITMTQGFTKGYLEEFEINKDYTYTWPRIVLGEDNEKYNKDTREVWINVLKEALEKQNEDSKIVAINLLVSPTETSMESQLKLSQSTSSKPKKRRKKTRKVTQKPAQNLPIPEISKNIKTEVDKPIVVTQEPTTEVEPTAPETKITEPNVSKTIEPVENEFKQTEQPAVAVQKPKQQAVTSSRIAQDQTSTLEKVEKQTFKPDEQNLLEQPVSLPPTGTLLPSPKAQGLLANLLVKQNMGEAWSGLKSSFSYIGSTMWSWLQKTNQKFRELITKLKR